LTKIPAAESRALDYPFNLSGGMQQRVLLSIAISCNPSLLILDEPTTALDVIVQADILDLLLDLKKELDLSMIFITHNIGIMTKFADKMMVMYAGKMMEYGETKSLIKNPEHPYTKALLDSLPSIKNQRKRLKIIKGSLPDPLNLLPGCRFAPRCDITKDVCHEEEPRTIEKNGRLISCHFVEGV
jgi:peptide/nickel transport system ATP-binding protein/oligopeptide transport system ATP-binding protein